MLMPRFVVGTLLVGMMILGAGLVSGQNYPNKPIRIVTSPPGGSNDLTARLISPGLTASSGQPVIVENRTAIIAIETVAKAPPDGYTLVLLSDSLWTTPLLQTTSYDPVKDFSPISVIARAPLILVVHPSVLAKSVKEFIDLAKARPGQFNYGSGATGGSVHLAVELFKAMAGINIVQVSFKGSSPAVISLLAGEVQVTIDTGATLLSHIKSGKLRALAITIAQPSALFPGLPTMAAAVPGYEAALSIVVLAPAKTPTPIINRLHQEIVRVLNQSDAKEKFLSVGIEVVGSSPEVLAAMIKVDMMKWGKLIKDAGIKAD